MKNPLGFLKNLVLCEKPLGVFQRTFISKIVVLSLPFDAW
jgi:hypothetical protein